MKLVAPEVPLFITRQFLYSCTLALAVFFVLLPISVVSYLSFYKTLVPSERFSIPFSHGSSQGTDYSLHFDPAVAALYVRTNPDFDYRVQLNLHAICKQEKLFHGLKYALLLADVHVSSEHIINCDLRYIYAERNWWVPYHLRYWVPPILVDILKLVNTDIWLADVAGPHLLQMIRSPAELQSLTLLDLSFLLVDWRHSSIDLVLHWSGMRYYLVEYYYTSMLIGVALFWAVSSITCVMSALAVLNLRQSKAAAPALKID